MAALPALGISGALAATYWWWVERCYAHNGWYPYPLFEALSREGRAGLFAGSAVGMVGGMVLLKWIYGRLNGYGLEDLRERPGRVKG